MSADVFMLSYLLLAFAALATWVYSRLRPLRVAPFGQLLRHMMINRVNRIAVFAIWWWVGWHFFGQPFPN